MRWPFMCKSTHYQTVAAFQVHLDEAIKAVATEYDRATKDGRAKVHAFMREANYHVFQHPHPDVAIRAVFQQAEREFRPTPPTMKEEMNAISVTAP